MSLLAGTRPDRWHPVAGSDPLAYRVMGSALPASSMLTEVDPVARRYLVVGENLMLLEYIRLLRPRFNAYWCALWSAAVLMSSVLRGCGR